MHLRALAPSALVATTLALVAAAPAAAETRYVYRGTLDGTVALNTSEAGNDGRQTRRLDASLRVRTVFPKLTFLNGVVTHDEGRETTTSAVDLHYVYVNRDVDPVDVVDCRALTVTVRGPALANPLRPFDPSASPTALDLIPSTLLDFGQIGCSEGFMTFGFGAQVDFFDPPLQSHFHARVEVPREQLGDSDIVVPFSRASNAKEKCPEVEVEADLVSCSSLWRGVLRLKLVEADDELLAPLVRSSTARVDRRATRAQVTARCPRGCRLNIGIFLHPGRGRGPRIQRRGIARAAAATGRAVARKAVTLPAGDVDRTIAVAIPSRHRAALRAAGRALMEVSADPPQGRTVRRQLSLRVGG